MDSLDSVGKPLWGGMKRFPTPISYDPEDVTHAEFIFVAANLFAFIFGVPPLKDLKEVAKFDSDVISE